ncbi:MAG TPA: M12 family metallo-peptidase [Gammaproteobacteria bacterium]|nr:M12 family metallo-peptidase [Gammaproteobacteria bacterium]
MKISPRLITAVVCTLLPFAAEAAPPVFKDVPAATRQALAAVQRITDDPATRDAAVKTVHVNPALFDARPGDPFELPIGPGYRVVTQKVIRHPGGITTFVGKLAKRRPPYTVTLTRASNGAVVGRIGAPDGVRHVLAGDESVSLVVRYGWRPRKPGHDWIAPPSPPRRQASARGWQPMSTDEIPAGPATIDVLVAYSRGVANVHPSVSAYLTSLIDAANTAYSSSGIDLTLRLAGSVEVRFGDGMSADALLHCVSKSATDTIPGCADESVRVIRTLRAIDAADIVMMMAKTSGDAVNDTAGIAYEGGAGECGAHPYCFSTDYAYAAMLIGFRDESTFTHEIGHSLGAGHDLNAPDNDGAFGFSHGHLYGSNNGTVMAYADDQHLIFSSPGYNCGDDACGNGQTEDNAETLRRTKGIVAAYSARVPEYTQSGIAAPGQPLALTLTGNGHGIVGRTASVWLLKNDEPVQALDYAVSIDGTLAKLALPANLAPGANYKLQFNPNARPAMAFTTPLNLTWKAPELEAFTVEKVGQQQATFSVTAAPHGLDTTLALSTARGDAPPGPTIFPAGASGDRTITLDGLHCGTRYYAHLDARNAAGIAARDVAFTTLPCGGANPIITAVQPGDGDSHRQRFVVTGSPNGATTGYAIQYGKGAWYGGLHSAWQTLSDRGQLAFTLDGLECGTSYQYRAIAYSDFGDAHSAPGAFTTAPCQPGALSISGDTTLNAGHPVATYIVRRSGGSNGRVTVQYAATGGTAKANREFLQSAGTLVFDDGQTRQTTKVPILLSPDNRGDYDYRLTLSDPTGGATLGSAHSVGTVIEYPADLSPETVAGGDDGGSEPEPSGVSNATGGGGGVGLLALATLFGLCLRPARRLW